jgi:hypothetical protein
MFSSNGSEKSNRPSSKFFGKLDKDLEEQLLHLEKLLKERNAQTVKLINFKSKLEKQDLENEDKE